MFLRYNEFMVLEIKRDDQIPKYRLGIIGRSQIYRENLITDTGSGNGNDHQGVEDVWSMKRHNR
jgi:hypothetical protein